MLLTLRYGDTFPALPPESMTGESTDDEAGDSDSDSSSHPLDLIPCHAQRNFSPHCKRVNSENSFFIDKSLLVEPSHHPPQMSMESGIRSAKVSFVEKPAEKATIRDNRAHASAKEDDFLSMFEDDAFAPLSNGVVYYSASFATN